MKNDPPEKKEGESLPRPRGEVSEYIYRTHEVLEEHAQGKSKSRRGGPEAGAPKASRFKIAWVVIAVLVAIVVASLIILIRR